MSWEFSMLFVHGAAFVGLVMLYRSPPCWMQKLVVVLFGAAVLIFVAANLAALAGMTWEAAQLGRAAARVEHVGVLLWVFRVIYQDRVRWTSSPRSPSS